jgi:hypothetical protein
MGTPIPDPKIIPPSPPGILCPVCWGVGKPFGDPPTPENVVVEISGTNKGPEWLPVQGEPVSGSFTLSQLPGFPCTWRSSGGGVTVTYSFLGGDTSIFAVNSAGWPTFGSEGGSPCELEAVHTDIPQFIGGTAKVTIPEII